MSIVRAKTNPYGPATLDIQIEQGADFLKTLALKKNGVPWDLDGATFEAKFSPTWTPGQSTLNFEVLIVGPTVNGVIRVTYPSASSIGISPLDPVPRKTYEPRKYKLGGWILSITQDDFTQRLIDGDVYLDRDPTRD